ncbi:MAG: hypothetical protein WDA24_02200 [Tissierellales bacterium]
MILAIYFSILCIVIWSSRKARDKNIERLVLWSYNYIFVFGIFLVLGYLMQTNMDLKAMVLIIFNALYLALKGVAFDLSFQRFREVYHILGDEQLIEIQIWTILLISSLNTAGTLSVFLLSDKIHKFKLWYIYNKQPNKILIVGDIVSAHALIDDISSKADFKDKVITYYTREEVDHKAKNFGNVRVKKLDDFLADNPINNGKPSHQYHIVLLLEDKNENIEYLGKLNSIAKNIEDNSHGTEFSNINITVFCDNEQLRFQNLKDIKLDTYLVSEEQLVVDKLREKHSPLVVLEKNNEFYDKDSFNLVKEPYSACIIGFGDLGQELLLATYENSRFLREDFSEAPYRALVIDENMKRLKQDFLTDVPYFAHKNSIEFCDTAIGTEEFYQVIGDKLAQIHQFFIVTGDSNQNVKTALKLDRFIQNRELKKDKPEIIFFVRDKEYDQEVLTSQSHMLYAINMFKDIYTYDNLILRKADELGKQVHENYKKNVKDKKVNQWRELSVFTKDSNRASARDTVNKLGLINNNNTGEDIYWKLAMYEHYRWCGFHYARGWTPLLAEELTDQEKSNNIAKRENEKKHLCLVSWDELAELPCQKSKTAFQEYDYEVVAQLLKNIN